MLPQSLRQKKNFADMVKDDKDSNQQPQIEIAEQDKSQTKPPQIFVQRESFQNDAPNFGGSSDQQRSIPQILKILVVDDDGMIQRVLPNVLKMALGKIPQKNRQEFEIITANNGKEGIAHFEMNFSQVRLVLTDFEMPGINGLQMSAKMRSFEKE